MRVAILTREWPPDVYGGAGVHVEHLAEQLRSLVDVDVHCFGAPKPGAMAHGVPAELAGANPALQTLGVDLEIVDAVGAAEVLHSHTWYANMAGHLGALLHDVPHVITAHSLEPRRPWKAEQLGGGYRLSSWVERTAYEGADAVIAVSDGMRADVLDCYPSLDPDRVHVVRNGIDVQAYQRTTADDALRRNGVDPDRPTVLFVGRITRQKGISHFIAAAERIAPEAQVVLCASSPDEPGIGRETADAVAALAARRDGVVWVDAQLTRPELVQFFSHATVFVCPSVYEPLGIVNLEAMACETAVVASAVGGIPEVVVEGQTGLLVPYDQDEPEGLRAGLAAGIDALLADPARAAEMGRRGRARVIEHFGWDAIARQTVDVYDAARRAHGDRTPG